MEEIAAKNIRTLLVKSVSPVLKSMREPPDNIEEYKSLYGSLGPYLQMGVVRSRQQSGNKSQQVLTSKCFPQSLLNTLPPGSTLNSAANPWSSANNCKQGADCRGRAWSGDPFSVMSITFGMRLLCSEK